MPSDSAALCLCGGGAGEQKKAPRWQLYYFTPKIVDSQCFGFFFLPRSPFRILSASDSLCRDGAAGVAEKRLDSPAAEAC